MPAPKSVKPHTLAINLDTLTPETIEAGLDQIAEKAGWDSLAEVMDRRRKSATERFQVDQNADLDIDGHWNAAGMPAYEQQAPEPKLIVLFDTDDYREEFMAKIGSPTVHSKSGNTWSIRYPDRPKDDVESVELEEAGDD